MGLTLQDDVHIVVVELRREPRSDDRPSPVAITVS